MQPRWQKGAFATRDGLALQGFDPVAYFAASRATPGRPDLETDWGGARWRFSTDANRQTFLADPGLYAPRCGGYCALAVSLSGNPDAPSAPAGSPHYWTVESGRLYVNANWLANTLFWLFARGRRAEEVWARLSAG